MAKLAALLGFSSVSAKLFKFAQRVHGQTLARFAALLALNDLVIDKHITVLTSAVAEFLETGSRHAGTSAWKSVRALEDALKRLPPADQEAVAYDLERYVQMLLSQDADLAKLIGEDIKKFGLLRLRQLASAPLEMPSKEARVIAAWKRGAQRAGGDLLKIFKRFGKLVPLDNPTILKASAYIATTPTAFARRSEPPEMGT